MNGNYDKRELKELKSLYVQSKALYETIKEMAEDIQEKVLQENIFYEADEWVNKRRKRDSKAVKERITSPVDTCLLIDADFVKFLDLCYEEYKKNGIDDPRGREWCPEAQSRDLFEKIENRIIQYAIDIIPDDYVSEKKLLADAAKITKYRDQMINLVMNLEC